MSRGRDVAFLQDRQRRDQLVAEIVALVVDEGEAGEGADHRIAAGEGAELALHAPDAHQHGGIDAVSLLRLGEPGAHVLRSWRGRARRARAKLRWQDRPRSAGRIRPGSSVWATILGSKVTPAKAASKVARLTPRASASGHSPATKARKAASACAPLRPRPFRRCRRCGLLRRRRRHGLSRRRGVGGRDGEDQRGGESGRRGEAAPDGRSEARHGHDPRWSARAQASGEPLRRH